MYYKNLLLSAILCQVSPATSQNLVKNPGFEDHRPVICIGCHGRREFSAHVNGWHNTSLPVWIFSEKYEFKKSEIDMGYKKKDYLPLTGDGVVEFRVSGTPALIPTKGGGGSGYLHTQLSKTLVPGTLYRLSMWLKIKNQTANTGDRFDFLKHFGMELSDKALKESDPIRSYTPFLLDTVVSKEWIPINYIIRPTRPLNHLTIGWFEHPLHPIYWRNEDDHHWIYILVDDISVTPILKPSTQDSAIAFDYPSEKPLKGQRVDKQKDNKVAQVCGIPDSINVYFDKKIDTLNVPSKALLDSLALCLKKDTIEYVLYIRGFTDVVGSATDNQALSERRAEAVKQYLRTRHHLSELRLLASSHGEEGPMDNPIKNDPGHQRRVEIVKSSIRVSDLIYRKLSLCATKGQSDSAFYWIKEWVKKRESDKILLLFDPELDVLHTDKRWKAIPPLVRQAYKKYTASATAFELDSVYYRDQYYRTLPDVFEGMKGYIPASLDISFAQLNYLDSLTSEKYVSHITQRLDKHGWPSPETVGERAALTPALILIHSQDLALRKKYLPMAEMAYKAKKIKPEWYAMLFDRIMMDEKGMQFYATQYKADKDDRTTFRLVPVENPELVNERRAAIGMYPKNMSFTWFKIVEKVKK
jgi:outer membrane protein OmpA-like peptidoglycan-associated protein